MNLARLFRRQSRDHELQLEIEQHLASERDLNLDRGMSESEASRQARLKFGSRQRVREDLWKSNSIPSLESLMRDVRYSCRTLLRSPGYAIMAVLTLGLGIGAN